MHTAFFDHFTIDLFPDDVAAMSHSGPCDEDVETAMQKGYILDQLAGIRPDDIRAELREYGAWDETELADDEQNKRRLLWIAAQNIHDG